MIDDTQPRPAAAPAGWYPDQHGNQHYWDGSQWIGTAPTTVPTMTGSPAPQNGPGIAALILGIIGVIAGLVPAMFWLSGTLGLIGVILGIVAVSRVRKRRATNGKTSWTGLIASAIAFVLGIVGLGIVVTAVDDAVRELDQISEDFERDIDELDADLEAELD